MNVPKLRFPGFLGEWAKANLSEISKIIDGDRGKNYPKSIDFSDRGFCLFLNAKNVTRRGFEFRETMFIDAYRDRILRNGKARRSDIILTTRGSVGHLALIDDAVPFSNIRINSGMVIIRPDQSKCDSNYLYIQLSAPALVKHVQAVVFGSAQPQLTVGEIKKFPLHLPPLPEQQKIAAFLGAVDAKLAALGARQAALGRFKAGLMQKLFSQQLRFTQDDRQAFPDWQEKRLGDLANIYQPKTISQTDLTPEGYIVYGANGIIGKFSTFNHELAQVIVTCRGSTCGTVTFTEPKCWVTGNAMVVNLDGSKHASKKFIYFLLSNTDWTYLITGSGQPQITGEIKKHKVQLPHPDEQRKIADTLSAMDARIGAVAEQITKLERFKKGLLQQMFV